MRDAPVETFRVGFRLWGKKVVYKLSLIPELKENPYTS